MTRAAIEVEGIGKRYRIGASERHDTVREAIMSALRAPVRNLRRLRGLTSFAGEEGSDVVWALRDITFDVPEGQVLGIIGRNGAGKSTLLKVLSRITEPTRGRALVHGQVGSLLEVGTGFHPELTGRDNVYLNGAILGMDRSYITSRFEEIVEFAGVEKFIDTPVKRYSSGMRVRLAFAVAAHLQPEILIIDEVLSVGDAEFQKKCLGKMDDAARSGRTVLFVSHNMTAIQNLCERVLWIHDGRIARDGETLETVHAYLGHFKEGENSAEMDLREWPDRQSVGGARIVRARLFDHEGRLSTELQRERPMSLEFDLEVEVNHRLHLSAAVESDSGRRVLHLAQWDSPGFEPGVLQGPHTVRFTVPRLPLNCGEYRFRIAVFNEHLERPFDTVRNVLPFEVVENPDSLRPYRTPAEWGDCTVPSQWALTSPRPDVVRTWA